MIIEATHKPFRYRWSGGEIRFAPGEPVHVVPELGNRILMKCGGKVRLANDSPFHIGQTVTYQMPVKIKAPTVYSWEGHTGVIEMIDEAHHLVLIIPKDEAYTWRWVARCYVMAEQAEPNGREHTT